MLPLACIDSGRQAHDELAAIGRKAAEFAWREAQRMEFSIPVIRELVASAVAQTVIDAFMSAGQPLLVSVIGEMVKHARTRIEELIREQQTSEASAAAPS